MFKTETRIIISATLILFIILLFNTCKEDDQDTLPPVKFKGVVYRDEMGNHLGTYAGPDDNDWKYDTTWTDDIRDIMNFHDTVDLTGTYLNQAYFAPEEIPFYFFPNPVTNMASAYILMPGKLKVRMAMIDENQDTVFNTSYKDQDTSWVFLDFSDTAIFTEGKVYRMYYTFSVAGNEDFYKGHGDVFMCFQKPPTLCLEYLEE